MNRLWMHYFGRGLVETEEDFGTQGTPPSHPELLDWLAGEFIRRGWSLKEMHRLIVTSNTYRQSSNFRSDLKDKDPRNLLLARQSVFAFEAEIVRDAALSASGLLDRTIGGPSVKPPQPEGVYAFTQTQKRWTADTGPARYRRGDVHAVFPQRSASALHHVRRPRLSNRLHPPRPQQHAAASPHGRQRRSVPGILPRPRRPRA